METLLFIAVIYLIGVAGIAFLLFVIADMVWSVSFFIYRTFFRR
jgi:hypothetical protein